MSGFVVTKEEYKNIMGSADGYASPASPSKVRVNIDEARAVDANVANAASLGGITPPPESPSPTHGSMAGLTSLLSSNKSVNIRGDVSSFLERVQKESILFPEKNLRELIHHLQETGGGTASELGSLSGDSSQSSFYLNFDTSNDFLSSDRSAMVPFVSHFTYKNVVEPDTGESADYLPWSGEAALLFIDMSGYSKISAALAAKGAHALSEAVNTYLTTILNVVVHQNNGDVVKFAGDAVMAVWVFDNEPDRSAKAALRCAMSLQELCGSHPIDGTDLEFRLHIGLDVGVLETDVFSSSDMRSMQRAFHFMSGEPLKAIGAFVDAAQSGEVVVSRRAARLVNELTTDTETMSGEFAVMVPVPEVEDAFLVLELGGDGMDMEEVDEIVYPTLPKNSERHFVHPSIVRRLHYGMRPADMAEMRLLTVLFIAKTDDTILTADWFMEVRQVLDKHQCPVVQILDDDKGVHLIAAVNLFVSESNSSEVAMRAMRTLRDREIACAVGCATGVVFCGVMGSDAGCRWDVTGPACVRACRLMQYAMKYVTEKAAASGTSCEGLAFAVDASVQENLSDTSALEVACEVNVKGAPEPVKVLRLATEANEITSRIVSARPFGPTYAAEYRKIRDFIAHGSLRRPLAIITGPVGIGKFALAQRAVLRTEFVAIVHTCDRFEAPLSVLKTIGEWFTHCWIPELKDLAVQLLDSHAKGFTSKTSKIGIRIVERSLALGISTSLIIKYGQFLDTLGLSFVQQVHSAGLSTNDRAVHTIRGREDTRWATIITHIPIFGSMSASKLRSSLVHTRCPMAAERIPLVEMYPASATDFAKIFIATSKPWLMTAPFSLGQHERTGGFVVFATALGAFMGKQYFVRQAAGLPPLSVVDEEGYAIVTGAGYEVFRQTRWTDLAPTEIPKWLALYDSLPPRYQMLLKVVSCIARSDMKELWPIELVGSLTKSLVSRRDSRNVVHDLKALEEIRLIKVINDKYVTLVTPVLTEVTSLLLTDEQCKAINKKAAELYGAAPFFAESPSVYLKIARFQYWAGNNKRAAERLRHGWALLQKHKRDNPADVREEEGIRQRILDTVSQGTNERDRSAVEVALEISNVYSSFAQMQKEDAASDRWHPLDLESKFGTFVQDEKLDRDNYLGDKDAQPSRELLPILVDRIYDNRTAIAHELVVAKNALPRLSLGPMCDMVLSFGIYSVSQHLATVRHRDLSTTEDEARMLEEQVRSYSAMVAQFESIVPPAEGKSKMTPEDLQAEDKKIRRFVATSLNKKLSMKNTENFLEYFNTVVAERAERAANFCETLAELPEYVLDKQDKRSQCLIRAFRASANPDKSPTAAFHDALMALAVANWRPGGETGRVTLEHVRSEYLKDAAKTSKDFRSFLFTFLVLGDSADEALSSSVLAEKTPMLAEQGKKLSTF